MNRWMGQSVSQWMDRATEHLQPDGTNSPAGASDLVPPERNTQDGLHAAPGSVEVCAVALIFTGSAAHPLPT